MSFADGHNPYLRMKEALVDLSVLLVFFTRQDTLQQVFDRVKEARPARLFLYQDGPRAGRPDDVENIRKCREIVSKIDWDCEVHTLYQEENHGPDESGYIADTWAFSQTDKCLVLEDDVVPVSSFFSFCKEMLDRYEYDERIMLISAQNLEEITKGVESDYFFSCTTFTWGWASWARVVNQWDAGCYALTDKDKSEQIREYMREKRLLKNWLGRAQRNLIETNREIHFETVLITHQLLHRGLTIVPTRNMACNIGLGTGSAHYEAQLSLMARGDRRLFTMRSFELDTTQIKHPDAVEDYQPYRRNSYRLRAWGHPVIHAWRGVESTFYQLLFAKNRGKVLSAAWQKACNLMSGRYS